MSSFMRSTFDYPSCLMHLRVAALPRVLVDGGVLDFSGAHLLPATTNEFSQRSRYVNHSRRPNANGRAMNSSCCAI